MIMCNMTSCSPFQRFLFDFKKAITITSLRSVLMIDGPSLHPPVSTDMHCDSDIHLSADDFASISSAIPCRP